jgi:hypothetical protein
MKNYLHKISIILIFLCFVSFLLQNKNFIENDLIDDNLLNNNLINNNLTENFVSEYKNIDKKNYTSNSLDTKNNNNLKRQLNGKLTIIENKDNINYQKKYCQEETKDIQEITNVQDLKVDKKFQTYGPTNYQDPNDMTEQQKLSFKLSYPNNMTLQDYVNWLMLYKDEEKNLSKEHVVNLQKLLIGEKLEYIAGILPPPTKVSPPLTSEDYFNNLYITDTFIKNPKSFHTTNSSSGNLMGYNYGHYPDFKKNFDVYGTSGRYDLNPDLFKKKTLNNFQSFMIH